MLPDVRLRTQNRGGKKCSCLANAINNRLSSMPHSWVPFQGRTYRAAFGVVQFEQKVAVEISELFERIENAEVRALGVVRHVRLHIVRGENERESLPENKGPRLCECPAVQRTPFTVRKNCALWAWNACREATLRSEGASFAGRALRIAHRVFELARSAGFTWAAVRASVPSVAMARVRVGGAHLARYPGIYHLQRALLACFAASDGLCLRLLLDQGGVAACRFTVIPPASPTKTC